MDTINIAIVEDEEECMHRLFDFCTQYEQEEKVRCVVHTFKKGIELLADYKPVFDVIFMDIEMPVMDGHRLTKLVKDDPETANIPIIIFSSLVNDDMRRKGEALGADAQLSKPEIGNLVKTVDELVAKFHLEQ